MEDIKIVEPRQEKESLQAVVKIEEWLFLILLGMIPVINLIAFLYLSFSRKINVNKRNFARAVLIYLIIILILVILTRISIKRKGVIDMKKNRSVQSNQDYPSAFSHAWQNEINRCMFGNLLTPFEYGNEFGSELIFNDLSMTSGEERGNSKK